MVSGGKKLTNKSNSQSLIRLAPITKVNFSISFQYFKQIPYFGIGHKDTKWFNGLIERLKDFCSHNSNLLGDYSSRDTYRLHQINWEQPNIPIQRKDLNWIPTEYLDNDVDYPIWQFEISKSTGRIVGFFDEKGLLMSVHQMKAQTENTHCSQRPAAWALEMKGGWFKENKIRKEAKLNLENGPQHPEAQP